MNKKIATSFQKHHKSPKSGNVLEMWLHPYSCKNAFPTKGRNCIFAARPQYWV